MKKKMYLLLPHFLLDGSWLCSGKRIKLVAVMMRDFGDPLPGANIGAKRPQTGLPQTLWLNFTIDVGPSVGEL